MLSPILLSVFLLLTFTLAAPPLNSITCTDHPIYPFLYIPDCIHLLAALQSISFPWFNNPTRYGTTQPGHGQGHGHIPRTIGLGSCRFRIFAAAATGTKSEVITMSDYVPRFDEVLRVCLEPTVENTGGVTPVGRQMRILTYFGGRLRWPGAVEDVVMVSRNGTAVGVMTS